MTTLTVSDVSFSYDSNSVDAKRHNAGKRSYLFSQVNFAINSNERVALCAPSGFGKTTLCRIMAGYLNPTKGRILLDGSPLPQKGVCPVQLVWQHSDAAVDPLLRMEQTLLEAGSLDWDIMRALGIKEEWLSRFPRELSGGELQRFCIARALRTNPQFLIADEMSTMLDAVTQAHIWKFLIAYAEAHNMGLVIVSHSPALLDRIATRRINLTQFGGQGKMGYSKSLKRFE